MKEKEIGQILKQARENKKIPVEEIHKKVKIKKEYVAALENDDVSAFPAEIYYKNFLRTYAKFLNVKSDELLANYESRKREKIKKEIKEEIKTTAVSRKQQKKLVMTLVFALVMGAGLITFELCLSSQNDNEKYLKEEIPVRASAAKKHEKQELAVSASGSTWINVTADGRKIFEGFLKKGQSMDFSAETGFILKIGNVLNASVSFNGVKADILAGASKNNVNTLTFKKPEEPAVEK